MMKTFEEQLSECSENDQKEINRFKEYLNILFIKKNGPEFAANALMQAFEYQIFLEDDAPYVW